MSKCWLYKKDHEPRIFDESEVEAAQKDGWVDSPAEFMDFSGHIDMEDEAQVNAVGSAVEDVKDLANDLLNVKKVGRKKLLAMAERHQIAVREDAETKDLRKEVREGLEALSNADSAGHSL